MENIKLGTKENLEDMQCAKLLDEKDEVWRKLILSEHHETKWKIIACSLAAALAFTWLPIFILVR